jgi:hypothetical protein
MTPTCSTPACTRAAIRTRDDRRVCLWHPAAEPPRVDSLGNLWNEAEARKAIARASGERRQYDVKS